MRIRPTEPRDLDRFREITIAAFEGVSIDQRVEEAFGAFHGHDWRWRKGQAIRADWEREPSGIFVAEIDGEVVGGITTWHDAEAGIGFIPNLAIDANRRGEGIGRKLIEHAVDHFRQLGLSVARIETLAHNEVGNHLYRAVGFEEVARQVHFAMRLERTS
ncbi:GNAT family N-acetyltransferase [Candidatus Laterigemmans baculatus]|uniref:GNAT family N-acetyltransferase n=1 Tax=Candidatus Laterigemmans baculatus TaxID=2770505 RepID=UPI0013D908B0|nr:GNAT family N-acetyltransferase [Candidatus Laterigemmans baculatus]